MIFFCLSDPCSSFPPKSPAISPLKNPPWTWNSASQSLFMLLRWVLFWRSPCLPATSSFRHLLPRLISLTINHAYTYKTCRREESLGPQREWVFPSQEIQGPPETRRGKRLIVLWTHKGLRALVAPPVYILASRMLQEMTAIVLRHWAHSNFL